MTKETPTPSERAEFEALLDDFADAVNDEALAYERGQTSWLDRKGTRTAVLAAFDAARASVSEDAARLEWQPIDSAPKDGLEVLLFVKLRAGVPRRQLVGHYMPGGHCIEDHPAIDSGWYFWNGCMFDKAAEPTHWMPMPPPPAIAARKP